MRKPKRVISPLMPACNHQSFTIEQAFTPCRRCRTSSRGFAVGAAPGPAVHRIETQEPRRRRRRVRLSRDRKAVLFAARLRDRHRVNYVRVFASSSIRYLNNSILRYHRDRITSLIEICTNDTLYNLHPSAPRCVRTFSFSWELCVRTFLDISLCSDFGLSSSFRLVRPQRSIAVFGELSVNGDMTTLKHPDLPSERGCSSGPASSL